MNDSKAAWPLGRIVDISPSLSPELKVWPGDPKVELERIASLSNGDGFNLSRLVMSVHAGAHVDAPAHYMEGGAGADALDLDALVGPARVFEIPGPGTIDAETLDGLDWPKGIERVIFKTRVGLGSDAEAGRNSEDAQALAATSDEGVAAASPGYYEPFSALDASGARWLVERGIRAIGIDSPSIATMDGLDVTHRGLLEEGVIPIEGLELYEVEAGDYLLICLPLKLAGADGAPARAILIDAS